MPKRSELYGDSNATTLMVKPNPQMTPTFGNLRPPAKSSATTQKKAQSGPRLTTVADAKADPHINGEYLKRNPTWHVEYSVWKAQNVHDFLHQKNLDPKAVGEVGCGAGEVLRQLQLKMDPACTFYGYDIAPPAIEMAKTRSNERLQFELADFGVVDTPHFDLLLILEVVDHIEDCFGFLRMVKARADWKLFSFSLDISVQNALREGALLRRRIDHSHLHHFSKETALSALDHTGYEVIDFAYVHSLARTPLAQLAKPLRRVAFSCSRDLTVRMFGGYSLQVLAR